MRVLPLWRLWGMLGLSLLLAGCAGLPPEDAGGELPAVLMRELDSLIAEEEPPAEPPPEGGYIIKRGDTLWSISRRFGISLPQLLDANPEVQENPLIRPGQLVLIPQRTASRPRPLPMVIPSKTLPRAEGEFIWPVRGRVLVRYGQDRPEARGSRSRGINIRLSNGQKVHAAKSGRVTVAESVPGFGRVVIIEHSDDTTSFYGYNSEILVANGATVQQGDVIALGGSSGRARSPQLHFRILKGNRPVDPLRYLAP